MLLMFEGRRSYDFAVQGPSVGNVQTELVTARSAPR